MVNSSTWNSSVSYKSLVLSIGIYWVGMILWLRHGKFLSPLTVGETSVFLSLQ